MTQRRAAEAHFDVLQSRHHGDSTRYDGSSSDDGYGGHAALPLPVSPPPQHSLITSTVKMRQQQRQQASSATEKPEGETVEQLHQLINALRQENGILRQRVEVFLTATSATASSPDDMADQPLLNDSSSISRGGAAVVRDGVADEVEVPRRLLLARIARLEAALRLEMLEREIVEQRLVAQEEAIQKLCESLSQPTK